MSPPIRDGSGSSIGSIRLGDGSEISEVRTGAGDVVFSANTIADSRVNRVPFTSNVGTTAAATVGSADVTLNNGGDRIFAGEFRSDVAPEFGDSGEDGQWSPYTNTPITLTTRVRIDPNGPTSPFFNYVYYFQNSGDPGAGLVLDNGNGQWAAVDNQAKNKVGVPDSLNGGDVRILAYRLSSSDLRLDVYQNDATTKVGAAALSNPDTSFSSPAFTLGNDPSGRTFGDGIDLTDVYDVFLSDSQLDSAIANVYG